MIIHTVSGSDTVYSLSKQYSVPESRIITDNFLDATKKLIPGQTLIISRPCKTCTVKGGDTLEKIAKTNGISVMSLMQNNPWIISESVTPSETLNIQYEKESDKSIIVSAYTGNASENEIKKKLPYISMLNIQNVAYINGDEIGLQKNGGQLISLAKKYRAMPILSFDCTGDGGRRNLNCLSSILESPTRTEKFIQSALKALKNSGANGMEMLLYMEDTPLKYKLYDLALALGGVLRDNGYTFSIPYLPDITTNESAMQFNDISDVIPVWSYLWDDEKTGSPASPIYNVEKALKSPALLPYIGKALLGIPTFGTEYSRAADGYRKRTVDAEEGLHTTHRYPTTIEFSEEYGVPFVNYSDRISRGEPPKTLYFEDARSYSDKLDLIESLGLAGVNIMSLDYSAPILWQLINQRFNILKY